MLHILSLRLYPRKFFISLILACINITYFKLLLSCYFSFQDRLEEHRKTFNPLDLKDYTDAFINESVKEIGLHGKIVHFTGDIMNISFVTTYEL